MTIRAVVWDLGGVILRTEDYCPRNKLAKRLGMTRQQLEKLFFTGNDHNRVQLGEISLEQHWNNLRDDLSLSDKEFDSVLEEFWSGDRLDNELIKYIRSLRNKSQTALLSNAFSNLRHMITEIWGFADAFDKMLISAEVGMLKPDDRIYWLALNHLGVKPYETVFIDDFIENVQAAKRLGLHPIHFRGPDLTISELEAILDKKGYSK